MLNAQEQQIIDQAIAIIESKALKGPRFGGTEAAKNLCQLKLGMLEKEVLAVLFLNNNNQLISFENMFTGTINHAHVYPREVAKKALELNAASVILSHNHPSGPCDPSASDRAITNQLIEVLKVFEIDVLDHIIVSKTETFSFAETGMI